MAVAASFGSAFARDDEIGAAFAMPAEIAAILTFEAALAQAQAAVGDIELQAADTIAAACRTLAPDQDALLAAFREDGVPVPALVKALKAAMPDAMRGFVHRGATSQDAVDTGLMLRLGPVLDTLIARIETLLALLGGLEAADGTATLMAQTRMQAALRFTVSDKLATWTRPLAAHRARLEALKAARPVQLGGPIGTGGSLGPNPTAVRAALAAKLNLTDHEPWHSDRTPILDIAHALVLISGTLGKIGQDIALMAQNEVATIRLAGGGGSSAMAHKKNPVAAEVLVALARLNAGLLGTLSQSLVHENERSGAAWTLEWILLPQIAEATGAGLKSATALLDGARLGRV